MDSNPVQSSLNFFRAEVHRINQVFLKSILLLTILVVHAQMLAISQSHFVIQSSIELNAT